MVSRHDKIGVALFFGTIALFLLVMTLAVLADKRNGIEYGLHLPPTSTVEAPQDDAFGNPILQPIHPIYKDIPLFGK